MIDKIKYLIRKAQQNKIVYFVSFPKSGRTWVRMFLNYYYFNCYPFSILARNRLYFDKKIPLMKFSHGGHDDYGDSSILDMEKEIKNIKNSPSIILIRDPRDVLVSYFFQLKKRIPESARKNSINNFSDIIDNKTLGLRRIIDFTNIWYSFHLNKENSLVVFYEKIKKNTDKEFKRILNFLDEHGYLIINDFVESPWIKVLREAGRRVSDACAADCAYEKIDTSKGYVHRTKNEEP